MGFAVTSLLAFGRRSSSPSSLKGVGQQHGYRPRRAAPSPPKRPPRPIIRYQVCQSPACTADGASATLEKMQAWAPANVIVEASSCVSLCGSGPIVIASSCSSTTSNSGSDSSGSEIKEKRIQEEERILQLLYPTGDFPFDLIRGYELVQQGDQAFEKEECAQALAMYEQAVQVAFRSAVELENERDTLLKATTTTDTSRSSTRIPKGLEWLIRARRNEATCQLKLGDVDGAMLAAQASCNLSRNTSAESFVILAEIYREELSLQGESQALEKAISLWSDDTVLSFPQKNQKRIASIRLQKVQREIELTKPKVPPEDLVSLQEKPDEVPVENGETVNGANGQDKEETSSQRQEQAVSDDQALQKNVTLAVVELPQEDRQAKK